MRKLASGSLILALVGFCVATAAAKPSILAAFGERIRVFRVSEPLLLLLLGMCLIVSASALPPRLRGRFRAKNSAFKENKIHLAEDKRVLPADLGEHPIDIPPQKRPPSRNKGSAAGIGS